MNTVSVIQRLKLVVVHELLEQFGIILDERRHDTSERLAVLNARIVLIESSGERS